GRRHRPIRETVAHGLRARTGRDHRVAGRKDRLTSAVTGPGGLADRPRTFDPRRVHAAGDHHQHRAPGPAARRAGNFARLVVLVGIATPPGRRRREAVMTVLAPILEAFFTDRLMTQRGASPHTIAPYRDTFTLLL